MRDFFLQMGLSNACFALGLAILAMVVGKTIKRPHLAYMLWLLVFVRLVTPPILTIPVVTLPAPFSGVVTVADSPGSGLSNAGVYETEALAPGVLRADPNSFGVDKQMDTALSSQISIMALQFGKKWLPPIWLLGSVTVFAWSMARVWRFSRLLTAATEEAPPELKNAAARIAGRLKLRTMPVISTTSARISPMVWWTGGKVRVIIPTKLLEQMDARQWQWILAHELAHVRRGDYLVRWIELLACVCFWWNPVVWWAQRNLRATEEICCDALVLSTLRPKPHLYANSLLTAVEFLAFPALRPPVLASEIKSGGQLERRFKMIISETSMRPNARWMQVCVLLCAVALLPLGLAYAQDYNAVEKRLVQAVNKGELSLEQAGAMMATLRKGMEHNEQKEIQFYLEGERDKLQAAVAEGLLSVEDAQAKMNAIRREKGVDLFRDRDGHNEEEDREHEWHSRREGWDEGDHDRNEHFGGDQWNDGDHDHDEHSERVEDVEAHYEGFGKKLKAAVREGKITEEEAREKWAAFEKEQQEKRTAEHREQARLDKYRQMEARIHGALENGDLNEEQAKEKLITLRKEMWHGQEEKVHQHDTQSYLSQMGISDKTVDKVLDALKKGGLEGEQIEAALKGIIRIIQEKAPEGDHYEMSPRLQEYYQGEIGFNDPQIEMMQGIARELSVMQRDSN
jgi:beta-lactamase regulating signal transducer with metallopeptidase domain